MANIKSIGGNPIVPASVEDGSITKDKLATDLARDRERLLYRLDNLLTNALPEGDVATATDAAKTPLAGLALYGRSTQDGTPTPSSPVPIVSVTPDSEGNISLWARGFNQWDEVAEDDYISDTTGENIGSNTAYLRSKDYIPVFPGMAYHFTCTTGNNGGKVYYYDADKAFLSFEDVNCNGPDKTTPAIARYMRFWLNYPGSYNNDICINLSDSSRNGTYQPYEQTVTPIPLDGHELRSLPDGTRDELTVDARGHAVLVQRVGSVDLGTLDWANISNPPVFRTDTRGWTDQPAYPVNGVTVANAACERYIVKAYGPLSGDDDGRLSIAPADVSKVIAINSRYTDVASFKAAMSGTELIYQLATPVTHDLGTIDPVPLCGPDLTAQAVPSAPFALTYERDLDATLARLESAIATLA